MLTVRCKTIDRFSKKYDSVFRARTRTEIDLADKHRWNAILRVCLEHTVGLLVGYICTTWLSLLLPAQRSALNAAISVASLLGLVHTVVPY